MCCSRWSFRQSSGWSNHCNPVWWPLNYRGAESSHLGGVSAKQRIHGNQWHFSLGYILASGPQFNNSVSPFKSLVPTVELTRCWCSEGARSSPWKSARERSPFKRCLQVLAAVAVASVPLSHSGPAASQLQPRLPSTLAGWLFLSLVVVLLFLWSQVIFLAVCSMFLPQDLWGHKRDE